MKKLLLISIATVLVCLNIQAQTNKCATMRILEKRIKADPGVLIRMQKAEIVTQKWIAEHPRKTGVKQVITIPVVVHVIWHSAVENISNVQIQSQIDILNEDFRLMNSDTLPDTHPYWQFTSDTEIEFCLAVRDPDGNSTSGITRTYTDSVSFSANGYEKATATGGIDNWDPTKYLNLWVCNLDGSGGTLGYAAFPSDLASAPDLDGVVIRYEAFGNMGTAGTGTFTVNDLGRTATHEVGHWLNLRHIWGDDNCGDDFIADTPTQQEANYGCPSFPHITCSNGPSGDMYMNYMDYVDDNCMNMFTYDQTTRMQAALNGDRSGLLSSPGCNPVGINEIFTENNIELYPNPNKGVFTVNFKNYYPANANYFIVNLLGGVVKRYVSISESNLTIDISDLENGAYFLQIQSENKIIVLKVFKNN